MPPRERRYRPYRATLWALYFLVLLSVVTLMIGSIVNHLRKPGRPRANGSPPTRAALRICLQDLRVLQVEEAKRFCTALGPAGSSEWEHWTQLWSERLDDLSDRCFLDGGGPDRVEAQDRLAETLEALQRLQHEHGTQLLRVGDGPSDEARQLQASFDRAELAVSITTLP